MARSKRKPKIEHIIKTGVNEKGEISKTQKQAIRTADSIFNPPSKPTKKKK